MAQVKIFGLRSSLEQNKTKISDAIHEAVMSALKYPPEKKFHRFFPMEADDFLYPSDRSENYTIIEISMFEGRSIEAKKNLTKQIFENIGSLVSISNEDIEITIFETPKENWGIRGMPGDELALSYKVDV